MDDDVAAYMDDDVAAYVDDDMAMAAYVDDNVSASMDDDMAAYVDDDVTTFWLIKNFGPPISIIFSSPIRIIIPAHGSHFQKIKQN